MGILILIVFGVLLRYVQMMNAQQELKMYTHRRALELAKARRDSGRYGSVSLTAMKEVFPVNIFSSQREPTYVSASSTISLHQDTGYYDRDGDVHRDTPDIVGVSYYQIGADMINNNEVIEMPYMFVQREIDPDKSPANSWAADVNWLKSVATLGQGDDPETEYDSLEPAPIEDVEQLISMVSNNQYSSTETTADTTNSESDTLNVTQTTTYRFMNATKVRDWSWDGNDYNIMQVYRMPDEDISIQTQKVIQQDRAWTTAK